MLLNKKYLITDRVLWIILSVCLIPLLLNLFGIDFGFVNSAIDPYVITNITQLEKTELIRNILHGRYVNILFVSASLTIAILTAFLALVDYRINKEISTLIVGAALFCSGLFLTFHILASSQLISIQRQQFFISSYTWFFSRVFHGGILILGCSMVLIRDRRIRTNATYDNKFNIFFIILLILVTALILVTFLSGQDTNAVTYPFRNIAKSYDLIPLGMYIFLASYLLPKYYLKYPSVFSRTILLSMIPAIACQLYMTFGSQELYDNNFNVSHFMMALTYFIPFVGIAMNYHETHANEKRIISLLQLESSERKATENTLKAVLDSSQNAIFSLEPVRSNGIHGMDYKISIINKSTTRIFNLENADHSGKLLSELIPVSVSEDWNQYFNKVLESGQAGTYEYYSKGLQKWLLLVIGPLQNGLTLTISDITKRKNAMQQLVIAEKIAVSGRIARSIAHEIRNPLTNINLSVEQLRSEIEEETKSSVKLLEIIERNSMRINQLISELLVSSRPSQLELEEHVLSKVIHETIAMAEDRARLKNVEINMKDLTPDALISVDKEKIKTALLNLIINAIEAVEENNGEILISSARQDRVVSIQIRDNGEGISDTIREHLFEPFNTGKPGGMGLGLSSVQNIIMAHQGEIAFETELGKGTTFTIRLPLLKIQ